MIKIALMREVVAQLAAGVSAKVDIDQTAKEWLPKFKGWSDDQLVDASERYIARIGKRNEMFRVMPTPGEIYQFHKTDRASQRPGLNSCECDGASGYWTADIQTKERRFPEGGNSNVMLVACARCNKGGYFRDHKAMYGTEWDGTTVNIPPMPADPGPAETKPEIDDEPAEVYGPHLPETAGA